MPGLINVDVGSIVNGAASLVNSIGNQIRGKVPVDQMELAKLEILMEQARNQIPTLLAKVDEATSLVNLEDSKSQSMFKSGWRPFAGWLCVAAMGYNYILMPFLTWLLQLTMANPPGMVALDSGELVTLLFGMLGMGALRTAEKLKK